MSEKNVTLISKNYAENVFVTEPQLQTELSKKQDDVGLSVNDDGNLNLDLMGITQIGGPFENIFDGSAKFYNGVEINGKNPVLDVTSSDGSVTVTRSGDGYGVDLKANGGGSIDENRVITGRYESYGYGANRFIADSKVDAIRLTENTLSTDIGIASIKLHNEDGPVNADFTVQTMISAFCPSATISIPCDEYGGYTAITSNRGTEVMRFEHDTSAGYDVYNTKIYFKAPVYDKDGNEITGGGGGGGGETKAKAWYCSFIGETASECTFYNLNPADEPEIESIKEYNSEDALITFKEEKSMSEVNEWLIFRAKMIMGMNPIYDTHFGQYVPTAICPWPEGKPWPEKH